MAKTKLCKYCKSQIDKKASICPHCQKKQSGIDDAFKAVIVAITLIIFVPAFIGACSKSSSKAKSPSETSVEVLTTAEKKVSIQAGTTEADATTVIETESATATEAETTTEPPKVENVVVYEQNGIKITYTGVEERSLGYLFKFLIENDSDIDINVMDEDLSVNSFMMSSGGMYTSVASHKKANDAIYVYKSSLEENSISNIEDIEFFIRIYDSNNLASHFDSDVIRINVE
jgi:hypothetical protein